MEKKKDLQATDIQVLIILSWGYKGILNAQAYRKSIGGNKMRGGMLVRHPLSRMNNM